MVMFKKLKKSDIFFWAVFIAILAVSFVFRISLPSQDLIKGDKIYIADVDAYYHLITADYVYKNWPDIQTFNPDFDWPAGQTVNQRPLNGWLIGTIAKFTGSTVEWVGLYWPAILGILVLIPCLLLAWVLWNRWAALMGVACLAVIPGEYYGRMALGVCDQHALEIFLMCWFVLFYVLSLRKNWLWSFAAGISLSLYIINWSGAPVLILIVLIYLVIQSTINQFKVLANNRTLALVTFIPLVMALAVFTLLRSSEVMFILFYGSAACAPLITAIVSKYTAKLKPYWYPVILSAIVGFIFLGLWLTFNQSVKYALYELQGLTGTIGAASISLGHTISEVQPILFPYGEFTLDVIIGNFGLILLFGLLGLCALGANLKKSENIFIFVWAVFLILITIMQRRYAYYSAIPIGLLVGYFFYWAMNKIGWRKYSKKDKKKGLTGQYFSPVIAITGAILLIVTCLIPNGYLTAREARNHPYQVTQAWSEALKFVRESTVKDVGIISWWDYGYWIVRDGQRPVICHPGGGSTDKVAKFFTAFTTDEANQIADELDARYVIIDYQMASQKFYAIPILAGKEKLTEEQFNDCILIRLYASESGIEGYREIFESSTKYDGIAQVKVYERYPVLKEPCNCGE
jgi:dolichyl-diphosphooligosaccharide--protein glycosyltransferase